MKKILTISFSTYNQIVRSGVYYALIFFFAALVFVSQWFTLFTFSKTEEMNMIRETTTISIIIFAIINSLLASYVAIRLEIEKLTTYTLLSKPVYRYQFLVGKFLGVFLSCKIGAFFLVVVFSFTVWVKEGMVYVKKANDYKELNNYINSSVLSWGNQFKFDSLVTNDKISPQDFVEKVTEIVNSENISSEYKNKIINTAKNSFKKDLFERKLKIQDTCDFIIESLPVNPLIKKLSISLNRHHLLSQFKSSMLAEINKSAIRGVSIDVARKEIISTGIKEWWEYIFSYLKIFIVCIFEVLILSAIVTMLSIHLPLVLTGVLVLCVYFLGNLNIVFEQLSSSGIVNFLMRVITAVIPDFYKLDASFIVSTLKDISISYILFSILYCLIYSSAVLFVGIILFEKKDI